MKTEKFVMCLINLALTAALAFSALVILEQLAPMGWEWYSRSLCCYPLLLCFAAGLAASAKSALKWVLLPLSCLASAVLIYFLFPSHAAGDIVYIVITLPIGAGIFALGMRGALPFPPKAAIATIIAYLFICAYFYLKDGAQRELLPMTYCALGSFLLSLYSFNLSSLRSGMHSTSRNVGKIPSGMRGRNMFMLTLFLAVAVPIASLGFLHRGLGSVFGFLVRGVWRIIAALSAPGDDNVAATPQPSREPQEFEPVLVGEEGPIGGKIFVMIFISIMLIAAVIFIIAILVSGAKGGERRGFRGFFKRLFKTRDTEDYNDSVERTSLKDIIKQRRERISRFFEKLTTRAETYDDMPNDRMRVRFAYKTLLASSRVNRRALFCTPNELAEQLKTDELTRLAAAYNTARYSEGTEVTPGDAETAKAAIASLRKVKRK